MNNKSTNNLESCYSKMTDEELIKIVSVDSHNYRADAIEIAQKELRKRDINDLPSQSNANHCHQRTENQTMNPIARNSLRILSYIVWVVVWLILVGLYNQIKQGLMVVIIKMLGINTMSNIISISLLGGIIHGLIFLLFFYVLYKGFKLITREIK